MKLSLTRSLKSTPPWGSKLTKGRKPILLVFVLLVGMIATTVLGHDTWLLPRRMTVAPGSLVRLDLTSGMAFPTLDHAIAAERVIAARYRLGGKTLELEKRRAAAKSLQFSVNLKETGVATLWVVLKPRALDLKPGVVPEYLDEIGASEEIRQGWKNSTTKRWREVYQKHAKTFVLVGKPEGDRSWAEPVGMALEIVPEKDPTALRVGDEFPVRVLKQGAPLAGFPVGLVCEGDKHGTLQKTNTEGRVTFKLSKAGRWLLRGTELRKATQPESDWESDFTTLTFAVH